MNIPQLGDRVSYLENETTAQQAARLKANDHFQSWLLQNPGKTRAQYHADMSAFREYLKANPGKTYGDFVASQKGQPPQAAPAQIGEETVIPDEELNLMSAPAPTAPAPTAPAPTTPAPTTPPTSANPTGMHTQ